MLGSNLSWLTCNTGYIIQTPFYSKGFWSLVLGHTTCDSEAGVCPNIFGVLQADKQDEVDKVDLDDSKRPRGIESAFEDAKAQTEKLSHPMLLPIELFINHFVATQTQFIDITAKMDEIETDIRMDLNEPNH